MLLFERTLVAFNYVLSCICPLQQDCKLPENKAKVFILRHTGTFRAAKHDHSSVVWVTASLLFQQLKSPHAPHIAEVGKKGLTQTRKACIGITMKILPLTFCQTIIVLGHCLGRIPLGNVSGVIILSPKLWILICFFSFKKINVERNTSDKQWDKDIISGEGMRCRKPKSLSKRIEASQNFTAF